MIEGSKVKEGFAFHESRSSNLIMYLDARTFVTLLLCTPDTDFTNFASRLKSTWLLLNKYLFHIAIYVT